MSSSSAFFSASAWCARRALMLSASASSSSVSSSSFGSVAARAFAGASSRPGAALRFSSSSSSSSDETHEDFKPVHHAQVNNVQSTIEADVRGNRIFVYMKGVPTAPRCGFSMTVCRLLDHYGAEYGSRDVLSDPDIRDGIKAYTEWPTIPQVFIDGEFVGGCDIMMSMHEEGELAAALADPSKK